MTEYRQRLPYAKYPMPKRNPISTAANRKMNDEVLTELYDRYSAKVFNTANCIIKDEEAASDIMQEVFITVWQKYETLREKNKVGAWITTITVNKCREYLRKAKKDAVAFSDVFSEEDSYFEETVADEDRSAIPEESVMDKQIKETLASLINELPEKQRICMLMYYGCDRKISDIAQTLEIPESTVKSSLNYGKKKLAAKVAELEKKGYILRGITAAAVPFFIRYLLEEEPSKKIPVSLVIRSAKSAAESGAVLAESAAAEGAASAAGVSAAASSTAAAGGGIKTAGKIAGVVVKFGAKSAAVKVISGVAAATVLVGGGAVAGSRITEKRLTENPPYAAVGEQLTDNGNLFSADIEAGSDYSESASEKTTAKNKSEEVISDLFNENESKSNSQTNAAQKPEQNSQAQPQSVNSENGGQPQPESNNTDARNQTSSTEPHTTQPQTAEPSTTEPITAQPQTETAEPETTRAANTDEAEETTGRGINGKKNGDLDDDDIWM